MARENCADKEDPLPVVPRGARLLPRLFPNAVALLGSVFATGMETMWKGREEGRIGEEQKKREESRKDKTGMTEDGGMENRNEGEKQKKKKPEEV